MVAKTSRLDLRLTDEQRAVIERAAELSGTTLSGWAVSCLTTTAREQVATANTIVLPAAAFDEFVRMLEEPWDTTAMDEFMARKPVWETPEWDEIRRKARA